MRRFLSPLLGLALVGSGFAAYRTDDRVRTWVDGMTGTAAPVKKVRKLPPAPVRTTEVGQRDVPILLEGVGNVQARSTVALKARVDGQLMEAAAQEGQLVAKGDLLFKLDSRPLEAQLRLAEANVVRDKANLEKAKSDQVRYQSLSQKGVSPKTKLEEAEASVAALEATVRASEAAVELARLNLEYSVIRALISGRVGSILQSVGNMVKANDTQSILMLTEIKPIYVAFALPEQYLQDLRSRMKSTEPVTVEVMTQGDEAGTEKGKLFFINNAVDATTGTILVIARFENSDERLVPGQFVKARVLMTTVPAATVVASKAIQINQNGNYVWVVKPDKTAELRQVTIGPEVGDQTVISRGLAQGEKVVIDGQLRLFPGASVAPLGGGKSAPSKSASASTRASQ